MPKTIINADTIIEPCVHSVHTFLKCEEQICYIRSLINTWTSSQDVVSSTGANDVSLSALGTTDVSNSVNDTLMLGEYAPDYLIILLLSCS